MAIPSVPHVTYDEFRNAVNGHAYDLDGWYGAQCWDGVDLLYQQSDVGQYLYTARSFGGAGTAKSCWQNVSARSRNGSGHFRAISGVVNIKRGDIIVFNTYSGWYGSTGHIGFADENYNGTDYIKILSQNYGAGSNPRTGKAFNIANAYLGVAFLGIFRYIPWESAPPSPTPTTETKKKKFPWAVAWAHWPNFKH